MKKQNKRIYKWLEIPAEVISNIPKITITGFSEVLIENYKGVLSYDEIYIRINTHIGIINVSGTNLNLNEISGDDILVTGNVEGIELESDTN